MACPLAMRLPVASLNVAREVSVVSSVCTSRGGAAYSHPAVNLTRVYSGWGDGNVKLGLLGSYMMISHSHKGALSTNMAMLLYRCATICRS